MFLHQKYGEGLCWVKDESIVKSSLMPVSAIYKTSKLGVVLENKNYYKAKNGPNPFTASRVTSEWFSEVSRSWLINFQSGTRCQHANQIKDGNKWSPKMKNGWAHACSMFKVIFENRKLYTKIGTGKKKYNTKIPLKTKSIKTRYSVPALLCYVTFVIYE